MHFDVCMILEEELAPQLVALVYLTEPGRLSAQPSKDIFAYTLS